MYKRQGQDDAALARQFHQLVVDSAAYMAGVRVGIGTGAVSYTHLDVYKRQELRLCKVQGESHLFP